MDLTIAIFSLVNIAGFNVDGPGAAVVGTMALIASGVITPARPGAPSTAAPSGS
ncbi:hypothetical protein [Acuticoccus sediminis]|uniref:hypothetical protein n=1 Tax=Acuticoccus sediminis TaxID=2184697 RepID=UPI001CFCB428|nr:hypothetical protein [Acuticoccus sediminis]